MKLFKGILFKQSLFIGLIITAVVVMNTGMCKKSDGSCRYDGCRR